MKFYHIVCQRVIPDAMLSELYTCKLYVKSENDKQILTHWCANSVSLGVNKSPNLCKIAVSLSDKFDGGGLHEESII